MLNPPVGAESVVVDLGRLKRAGAASQGEGWILTSLYGVVYQIKFGLGEIIVMTLLPSPYVPVKTAAEVE